MPLHQLGQNDAVRTQAQVNTQAADKIALKVYNEHLARAGGNPRLVQTDQQRVAILSEAVSRTRNPEVKKVLEKYLEGAQSKATQRPEKQTGLANSNEAAAPKARTAAAPRALETPERAKATADKIAGSVYNEHLARAGGNRRLVQTDENRVTILRESVTRAKNPEVRKILSEHLEAAQSKISQRPDKQTGLAKGNAASTQPLPQSGEARPSNKRAAQGTDTIRQINDSISRKIELIENRFGSSSALEFKTKALDKLTAIASSNKGNLSASKVLNAIDKVYSNHEIGPHLKVKIWEQRENSRIDRKDIPPQSAKTKDTDFSNDDKTVAHKNTSRVSHDDETVAHKNASGVRSANQEQRDHVPSQIAVANKTLDNRVTDRGRV